MDATSVRMSVHTTSSSPRSFGSRRSLRARLSKVGNHGLSPGTCSRTRRDAAYEDTPRLLVRVCKSARFDWERAPVTLDPHAELCSARSRAHERVRAQRCGASRHSGYDLSGKKGEGSS